MIVNGNMSGLINLTARVNEQITERREIGELLLGKLGEKEIRGEVEDETRKKAQTP